MLLRWVSMCVWAAVAASVVFWGLRLFTKPTAVPAQTQVADLGGAARGDLSRVLGVDPPPPQSAAAPVPAADARFSLVGVVSPRGGAGTAGVALIAVDGKAPKAYRLGAVVEGQNVLQSISARGASLGPKGGPALVALNIPPPAAAATGQLPSAAAPPAPAVPPPRPYPGQGTAPMPAPVAQPLPLAGADQPSQGQAAPDGRGQLK